MWESSIYLSFGEWCSHPDEISNIKLDVFVDLNLYVVSGISRLTSFLVLPVYF